MALEFNCHVLPTIKGRVDVTSASLPPSLPRARAPGRGKRLTLPLLRIKMQYINEISLKMTKSAIF